MDIVSRKRINLLINLANIQRVDSRCPKVDLIKRVADECNFSKQELAELLDSPEPIGSFGALSQSQKKQYMYNICELMAMINIDFQKKLLFQKVAHDLEYDNSQLNNILDTFQKQMKQSQTKDGKLQKQVLVKSIA